MKNLASLLEKEQTLLDKIGGNRKITRTLLSNNLQLREELTAVRHEIVESVTSEMETNKKSLYRVVKESLGKIDGRYNKIYDLINKPLKK